MIPKSWPLEKCADRRNTISKDQCDMVGCVWGVRDVSIGYGIPNPWVKEGCQPKNRRVEAVTVWTGHYVDAIQFQYDDLTNLTFGSIGGIQQPTWNVPPGEYITEFTRHWDEEFIGCGFKTSAGTSSPWYGGTSHRNSTSRVTDGCFDNYCEHFHIVGLKKDSHCDDARGYTCIPGSAWNTGIVSLPIDQYAEAR
jgi:hypothetical protein